MGCCSAASNLAGPSAPNAFPLCVTRPAQLEHMRKSDRRVSLPCHGMELVDEDNHLNRKKNKESSYFDAERRLTIERSLRNVGVESTGHSSTFKNAV